MADAFRDLEFEAYIYNGEKRFLNWSQTPLTGVSFSASGLLALADLSTIAKRTALTGTSSWLDVLFLAPGIHYQQLAEDMGKVRAGTNPPQALNLDTGLIRKITNSATIHYLQRIGKGSTTVILDVGPSMIAPGSNTTLPKDGHHYTRKTPIASRISEALYLMGPILTITAIVIMVMTEDWWGCGLLGGLMLGRVFNVWIIRQRTRGSPPTPDFPNQHEHWWVNVDGHNICLRGLAHDLDAITTGKWMSVKTDIQGYFEAASKLIVYLIAIVSGNSSQTGDLVLIALLTVSSGLLALSNSCADTFSMNGRVASVTEQTKPDAESNKESTLPLTQPRNRQSPYNNGGYNNVVNSGGSSSGIDQGTISDFEKQEAITVVESALPFSGDVNNV